MTRRMLLNLLSGTVLAVSLAGCTTPYGEPNHTGTGLLIGGLSGAGLGAMVSHHNPGMGALFGGAAGAMVGGLIGNSVDQQYPPPAYAAAPAPAPRYVWVQRQWVWNGQAWVWMEGHWAAVP